MTGCTATGATSFISFTFFSLFPKKIFVPLSGYFEPLLQHSEKSQEVQHEPFNTAPPCFKKQVFKASPQLQACIWSQEKTAEVYSTKVHFLLSHCVTQNQTYLNNFQLYKYMYFPADEDDIAVIITFRMLVPTNSVQALKLSLSICQN